MSDFALMECAMSRVQSVESAHRIMLVFAEWREKILVDPIYRKERLAKKHSIEQRVHALVAASSGDEIDPTLLN